MTKRTKIHMLAGLMMFCFSVAANASPIVFTYTVTGNANPTVNFPILSYSFVPTALPLTIFGPLDVRYQGDINLLSGSGPTTAVWNFDASNRFFGDGLELVDPTDPNGIAPFHGTSRITGGTGIFTGATGNTSYVGTFDTIHGIASFTETITLTQVPEPTTLTLLSVALTAAIPLRRWRRNPVSLRRVP